VAHRVLRRLAERLSESGYHVLRFDYYGTGDSAGAREEGDLASWGDDASLAVNELRDMSGFPTVAAFGVRLGAVVGWRLAQARDDVHTVVLWDPVVDGAGYVQELVSAQAESDRWSLSPAPRRRRAWRDQPLHALGFPLATPMRQSIEAVRPEAEFARPARARVHLFYSTALPEPDPMRAALERAGTSFRTEVMPGQSPWREDETIGTTGLPLLAFDRMVEVLP
jgi:pimeloyl-ACP methyl ester carboxylesterase